MKFSLQNALKIAPDATTLHPEMYEGGLTTLSSASRAKNHTTWLTTIHLSWPGEDTAMTKWSRQMIARHCTKPRKTLSETSMINIENDQTIQVFSENLKSVKEQHLFFSSLTAKLWMQYMDMVELLRTLSKVNVWGTAGPYTFIVFMACSHTLQLPVTICTWNQCTFIWPKWWALIKPTLKFINTSPKVCTLQEIPTDCVRAGLSLNLIIEQCLMRSFNTTSGLTRGWGWRSCSALYGYCPYQLVQKSTMLCNNWLR